MSQKTLVIGDNLKTDIKGANNMKLDSIFITSGVHKDKAVNEKFINDLLKQNKVKLIFSKRVNLVNENL